MDQRLGGAVRKADLRRAQAVEVGSGLPAQRQGGLDELVQHVAARIPLLLEAAVGDHERTAELEPGRTCHDRAAGECRTAERRVGKEWVSTCRSLGSPKL